MEKSDLEVSNEASEQLASGEMDQNDGVPAMAPVLIRSDIPELKGQVDSRVLACVDLTWKEYLMMFNVELSSDDYIVKGNAGRELSIDSKIGDYIASFKRKMKVHPVAIEKIKKPKVFLTKSLSPPPIPVRLPYTGKKRGPKKKKRREIKVQSPPPKRMRLGVPSISPPPDILKSTSNLVSETSPNTSSIDTNKVESETLGVPCPLDLADPMDASKSHFHVSAHITTVPIDVIEQNDVLESSQVDKQIKLEAVSQNRSSGGGVELKTPMIVLERQNIVQQTSTLQNNIGQSSGTGSNDNAQSVPSVPPYNSNLVHRSRIHNNEQRYPINVDPAGLLDGVLDSSEEDDESITTDNFHSFNPIQQPTIVNLKPSVMNFMTNKMSNRDMLKVREELMKLRGSDDYFKLTAITPLAAGLLEQMLCRSVSRQN